MNNKFANLETIIEKAEAEEEDAVDCLDQANYLLNLVAAKTLVAIAQELRQMNVRAEYDARAAQDADDLSRMKKDR